MSGPTLSAADADDRPWLRLLLGLVGSLVLLGAALAVGWALHGWADTLAVVALAVPVEVFAGVVLALGLHFDPLSAAVVSTLANLVQAPILIAAFDWLAGRWRWLRRKRERAEGMGRRWGRYGVWGLVVLTPLVGVAITVAVGTVLRVRPATLFLCMTLGIIVAALLTAFGGMAAMRAWFS